MRSAFRMRTAMLKALKTSYVLIVVSIAHPKILMRLATRVELRSALVLITTSLSDQ